MTDAIPPLQVDILFNVSSVGASINKVNAGIDNITARTDKLNRGFSGIKQTMLGVFGGNLITQGVIAIQGAVQSMTHEFQITQQAMTRLGIVFDNMGIKSKEQRSSIIENIEAYTKLGFASSDAADGMGTLIKSTGDVTQSTKLLALAADYARDRQIPLASAARLLAMSTQGSMKVFKQYNIALDESLPKNKAIAKAFDELNAKIGGQAKAATSTAAVQFQILKQRFQTVFDVVATKVIPIFTIFFEKVNSIFEWIKANSGALTVFAVGLGFIATAMYGVAAAEAAIAALNPFTYIVAGVALAAVAFVKLWNNVEAFRKLMAGMASVAVQAVGLVVGAIAKLIGIMSKIPGLGFMKGIAEAADKAAVSIGKTGESIEKLANKKFTTPKIPGLPTGGVKPGNATGITGNVKGGDTAGTGGKGTSNTVQYVTVYASNTNDIYKNLSKAAKNGVPVGAK